MTWLGLIVGAVVIKVAYDTWRYERVMRDRRRGQ